MVYEQVFNSVALQYLISCTSYFVYLQRWTECTTPQIHPKIPKDELTESEKGDLDSIEESEKGDLDSIEAQKNRDEPPAYHEVEKSGVENPAFEKEQRTEL